MNKLFLIIVAVFVGCTTVPAGNVGVKSFMGDVSNDFLDPGFHFVSPFTSVIPMSVQTREIKESMATPSKEQMLMTMDVSAIFKLTDKEAVTMYKTVGAAYDEVVLIPYLRAVIREVTGRYTANEIMTSKREQIALEIAEALRDRVKERGIIIEATPVRDATPPKELSASITNKLQADQENQRMEFVLLKEKQEAERKRIEAQGVADFQKIVSAGISEPLLKWKGIEATERLATSTNTKVVVIGGKDGLPLILGN